MPEDSNTVIGNIIDVQGGSLTAALIEDEQGRTPTITIGDEDIYIGQIGSYVSIHQGDVKILALVNRMTEQEKLAPIEPTTGSPEAVRMPYAKRIIVLVPLGTINLEGEFERGVSLFPTTGAEVHAIGSADINLIFSKFQSKGYDVGNLSSNTSIKVCLDPTSLFGRHFAILGQTGAGKSWTVANLVQRAVAVMPKAHIIILDLHGEYCWSDDGGSSCSAFSNNIVRYVDARKLEIPYWLMTYAELCDLLIDHTEREAHNQISFFRDNLRELKEAEKSSLGLERVTVDTPVYFSLDDLLRRIDAENRRMVQGAKGEKQGPNYGVFDRFIMRLESKLNDVRYDFLLKPKVRTPSSTVKCNT
ncbi:MAG: ATP-binding protein [Nitrospirota bacterium]